MVLTEDLARLLLAGLCLLPWAEGLYWGGLLWVLVKAECGEFLLAEWEFLREHPEGEKHRIPARLQG